MMAVLRGYPWTMMDGMQSRVFRTMKAATMPAMSPAWLMTKSILSIMPTEMKKRLMKTSL